MTIDGPDDAGKVTLTWHDGEKQQSVALGEYEHVAKALAAWLEKTDFGQPRPYRVAIGF